jgi:hypothetical protein
MSRANAWDEVMAYAKKMQRIQALCKEIYNTENMKGYTSEQRDTIYKTYATRSIKNTNQ